MDRQGLFSLMCLLIRRAGCGQSLAVACAAWVLLCRVG